METNFTHHQSAHCENGVASNLLKHNGLNISEPMVFGIGSGLFFVYLPFIKVNYAPAISYRPLPGLIFNRLAKRLGIKIKRQKFSNEASATKALDEKLKNNIPSGLQVGVYNLTYFPDEYRFHFNAHNLVVYGKTDTDYLISDPVMEHVTTLTHQELNKVRFAKGAFAPKGQMYYPIEIPKNVDFKSAIIKGIKTTCRDMLAPVPIVGVKGIRFVAKQIRKWPIKNGTKKANHYLAQMVRMQEEIGTGGGGFRFIYAAFLEEASGILENNELKNLSKEMTVIGDLWRDFAVEASRVYKNRSTKADVYNTIADQLLYIADQEEAFFKKLKKAIS
ncbi:hypothetical protein HNQ02_001540 [Flavobacterium sp. 7E]|uniref:BtrH N-terminal domain-containing protein n=1 Tax=Flavobacterium sp. 7E TaxID=2735898 RepID=UPI00157053AB|nr:BtrH N-terminal domain-containing protein [Flavobacterium sp. 7E]NRS88622.1 hypothetical protein [Flavobacterium sp. 7E]